MKCGFLMENKKISVSNKNIRGNLDDEDVKTLSASLKRLSSLESIDLNFHK